MTRERAIEVLKHTTGNINWDANREEIYFTDEWVQAYEMAISALKEQDVTDTNVGSKWISVKERLPEIIETRKAGVNTYRRSIRVLCACLQADGKRFVKEGFFEFFNDWPDPRWRIPGTIHSVTHWMPLPEPPKEDAE